MLRKLQLQKHRMIIKKNVLKLKLSNTIYEFKNYNL